MKTQPPHPRDAGPARDQVPPEDLKPLDEDQAGETVETALGTIAGAATGAAYGAALGAPGGPLALAVGAIAGAVAAGSPSPPDEREDSNSGD